MKRIMGFPDEPTEPHFRNTECPGYSECLQLAVDLGWAGFHCGDCPARNEFVDHTGRLIELSTRSMAQNVYPSSTHISQWERGNIRKKMKQAGIPEGWQRKKPNETKAKKKPRYSPAACVICGGPIPVRSGAPVTCGPECGDENYRQNQRARWRRRYEREKRCERK